MYIWTAQWILVPGTGLETGQRQWVSQNNETYKISMYNIWIEKHLTNIFFRPENLDFHKNKHGYGNTESYEKIGTRLTVKKINAWSWNKKIEDVIQKFASGVLQQTLPDIKMIEKYNPRLMNIHSTTLPRTIANDIERWYNENSRYALKRAAQDKGRWRISGEA